MVADPAIDQFNTARLVGADRCVRPDAIPDATTSETAFPTRNLVDGNRADAPVRPYQPTYGGPIGPAWSSPQGASTLPHPIPGRNAS